MGNVIGILTIIMALPPTLLAMRQLSQGSTGLTPSPGSQFVDTPDVSRLAQASLPVRAVAVVVDSYVTLLPSIGLALIGSPAFFSDEGPTDEEVGQFFAIFYLVFLLITAVQVLWTGIDGLTVGKALVKIQVVRFKDKSSKVGMWRSFGRYLVYTFAVLFCYLPLWVAILDKNNRSIHDHMLGTVVVSRRTQRFVST